MDTTVESASDRSDGGSRAAPGPVLGRALRVLGAFSPARPALTLSELSRSCGLPTSTVHRMLGPLLEWGALERGADGRYRVGLRLWELGALAPRGPGLRERALPYLEDLFQSTGENVQLAVREGTELVFVERIRGTGAVPVLTRVGGRFAMTATGVGLVLLAHAPREVQDEVLAGPVRRFTERTLTDPQALRRVLGDIRRVGYAVSDRQVTMDALSVAAPVYGPGEGVVAAVSLVVRHCEGHPRSPHLLAPLVCTTARAITRALGTQPTAPPAREATQCMVGEDCTCGVPSATREG
ncbi:IclR family transcriptional regulator [Streptomyces spinoverrucosus]|uniref:Glycerol operon regulatory protein n=1 Tax=Streptomyces spinoverrucosus TaxID=284043 RepID=A0A4Y3VB88_9ACTN|nr:IclR family transcriptional regulator [Streptomyces spinoverrucosus]GEC03633.1 IclR family transcriptional regulator [Streptomyces spinoverrucosus]GHB51179.1 IclR family transcriptional regulator [Streptomyces spinoverrucosus]